MNIEIFFIIFTCLVAPLILFFSLLKKKKAKLPPGPRKLPIIGNLHQLGKLPHRSLHNLSKKHGDLMFLQLGSIPTLIVSSADMAREIIKNHDIIFSGRPPLHVVKKITYGFTSISFAPYGQYWRDIRKIIVLELMTAKRVQSFENVRIQEVALLVDQIARSTNPTIDLSALSFSLSNTIVSRVAFGTNERNTNSNLQQLFCDVQHLIGELNFANYFPRMAWLNKFNGTERRMDKLFRELDILLDKVLEKHLDLGRSRPENDDIIDVLIRTQKDPNQDFALTNEQIKAILMDVFFAGTDTSSATIIWTMAELIRNPRVLQKAQEEVREIAKTQLKIEEADLPKLTYLKLVIKESFRLHPPAPLMLPRETTENCTIDNRYEIPAKTRVFFNATAIQTDPKYWADPDKFCPERFLGKEIDFRGQNFELLPFGAGRRACPGINFAIPLVELALANLLFAFDWKLPQGMSPEDVDMEEALGITMQKKIPLCLVASPARFFK